MQLARTIFLCCYVAFGLQARAQQGKTEATRPDISALENNLKIIREEDQQILSNLNEIKQLLAANANAAARPAEPTPPSEMTVGKQDFRGGSDAPVAIIEYADFECPFCGQYEHDIYPQISKDYIQTGKVKYFFRDLPLPMHPHAIIAARAAHCAGEQGKYWEMHDSLFAKQNAIREADMPGRAQELGLDAAKFSECLSGGRYTDEINKTAGEAQKMGIGGTPTFFIGTASPDGEVTNLKMIIGARPYEVFKSAIDDTLAAKK
jgi:protein-disulfide isomerase